MRGAGGIEHLCFNQTFVLWDSFVLRNTALLNGNPELSSTLNIAFLQYDLYVPIL